MNFEILNECSLILLHENSSHETCIFLYIRTTHRDIYNQSYSVYFSLYAEKNNIEKKDTPPHCVIIAKSVSKIIEY